jgi:Rrf2 family iron-sulfur cluster assembly transcriptional regulator
VESVRGPGGGYNLARPATGVSVADIIVAVDEPIDATKCGGKENCQDDKRCMTHELWANLNTHIFSFLRSVSLDQLVRAQDKGEVNVLQDRRSSPEKKPEPAAVH